MVEEGSGRVQSLVEAGISQVPPQYIQPPESRPGPPQAPHSSEFPCIDLSETDRDRDRVREAIGKACLEWGAFHVTNHGVPVGLLDRIRSLSHSFFEDLSLPEKLNYACDPSSPASQGYGTRMLLPPSPSPSPSPSQDNHNNQDDTFVLDWRDYFDHHTLPLSRRDPSRWPHYPPSYREVVAQYSDEMGELARRLMGLISESVGMGISRIEDAVGGEIYQNVTVSYYPPCPQPDLTLGLQSHSDMGLITLLIQDDDVEGLQLFKDNQWVTLHPLPHAILVLLSDQIEIITNGKYRSAQHRAITNSHRPRLSVATFHDPPKTTTISPAPDLLTPSSPPRYRPVNYGHYVSSWYSKGPKGKRNLDALLLI
ncbi:hypothetical protein Tsubulata_009135 [Turnera subulata]|uniref:Fe2OG dioxygenase domain-containing protein n=1 Tax=Turnera subulata TaxID=218843 RepID=A0A9Q0GEK1_9ROSI|nr:hypothetical protein Tsubulata_009135 [Turnera subulata]